MTHSRMGPGPAKSALWGAFYAPYKGGPVFAKTSSHARTAGLPSLLSDENLELQSLVLEDSDGLPLALLGVSGAEASIVVDAFVDEVWSVICASDLDSLAFALSIVDRHLALTGEVRS